jgi:hypothetical protein
MVAAQSWINFGDFGEFKLSREKRADSLKEKQIKRVCHSTTPLT